MIEIDVNNKGKVFVEQRHANGNTATTSTNNTEYTISPGDFITMFNWYALQKSRVFDISCSLTAKMNFQQNDGKCGINAFCGYPNGPQDSLRRR